MCGGVVCAGTAALAGEMDLVSGSRLEGSAPFFRREFQLPEKPVGGTLNFSGDDVYTIWVNGRRIHRSVNFKCPPFEAENI